MGRRHELSDEQWNLIKQLLSPAKRMGRPRADDRQVFNGIFWILNTGAPWRDLPSRYGNDKTVYHRFNQYRCDGTLDRIISELQLKLDEDGRIDWDLFCVDGSVVRATRSAAGAQKNDLRGSLRITRLASLVEGGGPSSTW